MDHTTGLVICPACGREHRRVRLGVAQRALCVECGTRLEPPPERPDAALAWTITALILAIPAVQLPLVIVRKFGAEHASYVSTGVKALWENGMPLLAVWVALCGIAVPLTLLAALSVLAMAARQPAVPLHIRTWTRLAIALQHWSMPEVHILAVLVAFVKIGVLVNVEPGAGLWFYAAMTLAMLFAWRSARIPEALA